MLMTFLGKKERPSRQQFYEVFTVLLLHDQEESAIVAQTSRVESGWEHVWILLQGSWE